MSTAPPLRKTFADYAAIAVCPVLIMLVVGSLIFFLLAIGYAGSHLGELRWTFFWFVLAMVLVSRIAIERGSEYAWIYGVCLAGATGFMLLHYVAFSVWLWGLLGLIWWATHKLTWDCTVLDEAQDASGEGLLQTAKLDRHDEEKGAVLPVPMPPPPDLGRQARPKKRPAKSHWWERGLAQPSPPAQRPHAPGVWVIYFSLGDLLVFGWGQGLLAKQDSEGRQYVFCLLMINLSAALGLLLISSFLGLRRYLRQRHLQMPPAMAARWLTLGTLIGLAVLIGGLLLPRPSAYWSLAAMMERFGDPAARHAKNRSGRGSGPGDTAPSARSTGGTAKAGQPPGQQASGTEQAKASEGESSGHASPAASGGLRTLALLLRLTVCVALVALGLAVAIKNRERLRRGLLKFWGALRELWSSLCARGTKAASGGGPVMAGSPQRPFGAFANPFASGAAMQMSPEDLVVQSFRGLEAWAEEHHCGRDPNQTPFEFADRVAAEAPGLAHEANQVARLYVQVAYAKVAVLPACRTILEMLWSKLTRDAR